MNPSTPAVVPPRRGRLSFDLPAWGLAAATMAGFAGRWNWILDLASHFRWYYLLAALVWYAITSRRRSLLATGCLLLTVLVNTWAMLPYWLPAAVGAGHGEPLDIVLLNLDVENHDRERVLGYLRARSPDVIVLLEVDDAWASAIRELDALYPHRVIEPYKGNFGLAVLSRLPLDAPRVEILAGGTPIIVTGLPTGAHGCVLVAAHPPAPIAAAWSERRDAQLAAMGELAAAESRPVIIAGDLNATPWCHGFRALVVPAGLRDSALGRGVQGSWHARHWAPRIPIDHVLVSPNVTVKARSLGPHVGSDHLPVEATLVVP
jgi:endonuclease/exonuclease/phosphatase (EEP) superfamily protein YafD